MEKLERLQEERPKKSPLELKKELLTILKPGETIVKAMRRLGGKNGKLLSFRFVKFHFWINGAVLDNELPEVRRRKPNNSNSVNKTLQLTKDQLAANRKIINRLTDIADDLFATKLIGVYDMTYEAIKSSTVLWEYKGLDGTIYGPYTSQQIADWKKQGFLTGLTAVQMRQVGSDSKFSDGNVPVGNKRKVAFEESAKVDSIYDEDVVVPKQLTASYKRLKADDGSSVAQETEVSIDDCNEWRSSDAIDFGVYIDLDANSTAVESAASNFNEEKEAASYPYGEVNDSDDDWNFYC